MCYQLKNRISNPWILLIIIGFAVSCKTGRNDLDTAKFLIDSIQSQVIADSRVELFAIKATWEGDSVLMKGKTTKPEAAADLVSHLKAQQIPFIDSIIRLPDAKLGDKTWALVTLSVVNMRYNPAHSAEMATQALMGTPLRVLQEENGWYLVQTPDRYIAWTESAGIALKTEAQMAAWKVADRVIFLGDAGLILTGQSKETLPVSDIVTGGILAASSSTGNGGPMLAVELPDGRTGFLPVGGIRRFSEWCSTVKPDSTDLVRTGLTMMGRPYLWGGTSVKGFDCSGFTKTLYLTGGLILSRDASQQVLQGTEVDSTMIWKGLKTGDLLFFGRKATATAGARVSHVGMYIGDSQFIHCSGMVRINSLDPVRSNYKPYYRTNLLRVKRIIGAEGMPSTVKEHSWYN